MNENEILTKFSEIVFTVLKQPFEVLSLQVDLKRNLGADSMDLVDILEAIEYEFDIAVSEEKAAAILNVGEAVTVIKELVDAKD